MTPLECEIIVGSIPAGAISRKGGSIWGMSAKGIWPGGEPTPGVEGAEGDYINAIRIRIAAEFLG